MEASNSPNNMEETCEEVIEKYDHIFQQLVKDFWAHVNRPDLQSALQNQNSLRQQIYVLKMEAEIKNRIFQGSMTPSELLVTPEMENALTGSSILEEEEAEIRLKMVEGLKNDFDTEITKIENLLHINIEQIMKASNGIETNKIRKEINDNTKQQKRKLFRNIRIDIRKRVFEKIEKERNKKEMQLTRKMGELRVQNLLREEKRREIDQKMEKEREIFQNDFEINKKEKLRQIYDSYNMERVKLMNEAHQKATVLEKQIQTENDLRLREMAVLLKTEKEREMNERYGKEVSLMEINEYQQNISSNQEVKENTDKSKTTNQTGRKKRSFLRRLLNFLRCS